MFLGTYEYHLDPKGRLAIPPRFREAFRAGMVLTPGIDPCIVAYPLGEWASQTEKLSSPALSREKERRRNRVLFANTYSQGLDNQGRIPLPPALRQHAGIRDEVVVAGLGSYVEIWGKEKWSSEKSFMDQQAWQIIEGIERL